MTRYNPNKHLPLGFTLALLVIGIILPCGSLAQGQSRGKKATYHSPLSVAISPDGKTLYTSDPTAGTVAILDVAGKTRRGDIPLNGEPRGVVLSTDGRTLYVAERGAGTVAVIDTAKKAVSSRIPAGRWPQALAVDKKAKRIYVCNQDKHSVSVIDLAKGESIKEIPVAREPSCAVLTPDEKYVVIANFLPHGVSTDVTLAAEVSIIDASRLEVASTVNLAPGSTAVQGLCVSPDGKWAYAVHQVSRFNQPVSQLELGWVNTYALSIINIAGGTRLATILLDDLTKGAATPYDVVCSGDGKQLWISHAGVHEISNVKIGLVHELIEGKIPEKLAKIRDGSVPDPQPEKGTRGLPFIPDDIMALRTEENIWVRMKTDPGKIVELENDLTALYLADAIRRFPTGGNSPRGIALAPDEKQLMVANYYTGSVTIMDAATGELQGTIPLGKQPEADAVRRGEILFHDASYCFQSWQSCATCHQGGGRIDGMRWDFLRDGIGNPKDTPNLVTMKDTAPYNWLATRSAPRECIRTGVIGSHKIDPTPQEVDDILAYVVSLRPEPSPYLDAGGKLTESAARGKGLFEGKAKCHGCHPAPLFTDKNVHNVGVVTPNESEKYEGKYDTPSLVEVHRTAPYLHDGRALTIKDVLTTHDKEGKHKKVKGLTDKDIDDLVEYVLSL
ncbi:MAG: beta-propeller fold lactonase family protein [Kiritimatiellia bacterium]|nr:beta-propeller fold lactonase family protein [Kiritimatiellia bacterium]